MMSDYLESIGAKPTHKDPKDRRCTKMKKKSKTFRIIRLGGRRIGYMTPGSNMLHSYILKDDYGN